MQARQACHHDRTDQEMQGDGRGYKRDRPAARVLNRFQEDRRPVEPDTPAEDGGDEGRPDHDPAEERLPYTFRDHQ